MSFATPEEPIVPRSKGQSAIAQEATSSRARQPMAACPSLIGCFVELLVVIGAHLDRIKRAGPLLGGILG